MGVDGELIRLDDVRKEFGDVTAVEGTGPQDSVVEADVERAAESGTAAASAEPAAPPGLYTRQ